MEVMDDGSTAKKAHPPIKKGRKKYNYLERVRPYLC
jgi:hypothetical protein